MSAAFLKDDPTSPHGAMTLVHTPTFRLNSILFVVFLALAVVVFMLVFPLVELVALRRMVRRKLEGEGLFPAP